MPNWLQPGAWGVAIGYSARMVQDMAGEIRKARADAQARIAAARLKAESRTEPTD